MNNVNLFNDEIKNKFDIIGTKLFNFKYSFDLIINYFENETSKSLNFICMLLILKHYFFEIKEEYNKLEEDLGLLV